MDNKFLQLSLGQDSEIEGKELIYSRIHLFLENGISHKMTPRGSVTRY